jgi:hypothetical protein
MVLVAELLLLLVLLALGVRWYLRTPMHGARKNSGVHFPQQVAGHMGFGMYSPSDPPLLPHALHGFNKESRKQQEPDADATREPGDA